MAVLRMSKKSMALIRGALLFVFGLFIVLFLAEMPKTLGGATGAQTAHADAPGAGLPNVGSDGGGIACVCEYVPGVAQSESFDGSSCGSGGSSGGSGCP